MKTKTIRKKSNLKERAMRIAKMIEKLAKDNINAQKIELSIADLYDLQDKANDVAFE